MKWIVGEKGGPQGLFHSVVRQDGRIIAMQIPEKDVADQIALLPIIRELAIEADAWDYQHNPTRHITLQKLFDVLGKLSEPK